MDVNTVLLGLSVLGGVSEALSMIPQIKSNGVFQLIFGIIKALGGKK
jgi:xanthine/uracil permease